ncbi:MAG: DEAD/DEAH box helicase, partial [Acidobacteriota bacterium]|nr:DEAD/DEAH box helicase [Acidobacteriota bacterium]
MQHLHVALRAGATVTARGDTWSVVASRVFDGSTWLTLEGRGPGNRGHRTTLIAPFDVIEPAPAAGLSKRRRQAAVRAALAALARDRPAGGLWTVAEGRFDVLPWQLSPTLAVLSGSTRILLADAVGMGKTLQAGLIAAELAARGLADHTLVLAPPGLRQMWADELGERLDLDVAVLDPAAIATRGRSLGIGHNPWTSAPVIISSIDFVKRPEVRAAVEAAPLDVLIVDEAHHLTPGSDRAAVADRLARRAPWLVLASATPHSGDPRAFRALLDLGRTGEPDEPPMRVFHRTPTDTGLARRRRTTVLDVVPSEAEQVLISELVAYGRAMCGGPLGARPGVRLVAGVLARRAASSAWAAERSLQRRLNALEAAAAIPGAIQPGLPWDEPEDGDDPELACLGVPGLSDQAVECDVLRRMVDSARIARVQPFKFRRLRRFLERVEEPTVVFTEFRDTLDACRVALGGGDEIACLHGGMSVAERRQSLGRFLDGRAAVLLATDVAGEGLNLQARARVVVTLEWPWNPQRLEQRVGRVDRLGQARTVHAVHLTARGTFEDTVVARVFLRAGRSRDELSRLVAMPTASAVEAAVLGGSAGEPAASAEMLVGPLADASVEAARIDELRRLAHLSGRATGRPCWAPPARRARLRQVALLVEVTAARAGRLEWSVVVPLQVRLDRTPHDRRGWRHVCRALAQADAVRRAAVAAAWRATGHARQWHGAAARLDAI